MSAASEIELRLDRPHIVAAATWVAECIRLRGAGAADVTPGDATRYRFLVSRLPVWTASGCNEPREYTVVLACAFGEAYLWAGHGGMDPGYCAAKWTRDGLLWTGVVVAVFLNALAEILGEQP